MCNLIVRTLYIGDRLALFALGSLATMANLNPTILIPGDVPYLGHRVEMYEPWFAIIWACIVGVHLAVFVATVVWGWRAGREKEDTELQTLDGRGERDGSMVGLVEGGASGGNIERSEKGGRIVSGEDWA